MDSISVIIDGTRRVNKKCRLRIGGKQNSEGTKNSRMGNLI